MGVRCAEKPVRHVGDQIVADLDRFAAALLPGLAHFVDQLSAYAANRRPVVVTKPNGLTVEMVRPAGS